MAEDRKVEDESNHGERIEQATERTEAADGMLDSAPVGNNPKVDAERGHSIQIADNPIDKATARTEDATGLTRRAPVANNPERIDESAGNKVKDRKDVGRAPAPVDTSDPDPKEERARVNEATYRTDREGVLRREFDLIKGEVEGLVNHDVEKADAEAQVAPDEDPSQANPA